MLSGRTRKLFTCITAQSPKGYTNASLLERVYKRFCSIESMRDSFPRRTFEEKSRSFSTTLRWVITKKSKLAIET